MMKKMVGSVSAVALGIALAVAPIASASAAPSFDGIRDCGSRFITLQSNAKGRVNHTVNGTGQGSWNNGSSYQNRYSPTGYRNAPWRAFVTGSGGDVSSAAAVCYS